MNFSAKWIRPKEEMGDVCPVFRKQWEQRERPQRAVLYLTALGVYEARINGERISEYVLAPGWTSYEKRLQYQEYEVTKLLGERNELTVTVGKGWFRSPMPGWVESEEKTKRVRHSCGLFGELHLFYGDGRMEILPTDGSWECAESPVRFSEIYDGESYDARLTPAGFALVEEFAHSTEILIPQEGEEIREMERLEAKEVFRTPAGEWVVDFGQEVTGYVEFSVDAPEGTAVRIRHGEVLDADGNFYNENYRSAKAELTYICREGKQTWHPALTFFGFRYLRLEEFPGTPKPEQFTAIAVYSNLKRTGTLCCSDPELNQLFSNIVWSQKDNFLDVPTDCPQRDERLGWTGDAQVFVKAACYNFDAERFFRKWLHDVAADQRADGGVGQVIPDYLPDGAPSAAWGDAAVICPWQVYLTYGADEVLQEQFASMKKWVDYITSATATQYLWTGGEHFGDWLGLDASAGSYKGASREDFIASAYYAYSTQLLIKAGHALGIDVSEYEQLYEKILKSFRETYPQYTTQTEYVLAVWFDLAVDPQKSADELAELIRQDGSRMRTGFVGTAYLLHALSRYGHTELAYTLLLRREYPSWLYPVKQGATTMWEHWDGRMEDGSFWSADMNSFNHYAYGAVADWIYEEAAGIHPVEEAPGFARVRIAPKPDARLGWLEASVATRNGRIVSRWVQEEQAVRFEIMTPVDAVLVIDGRERQVGPGSYTLWGQKKTR